jgi:YihY family inner membrane protein
MNETPKHWKNRLEQIPVLGLALRAIEKGNQDDAKDMAASIAYFSFFSLFPLLVGVVAGASLFLDRVDIQSHLDRMLSGDFPGSAEFLRTNIEALIDQRGAASIASVVGLLWSASKMFGALNRGINLAFGVPEGRPFYLSKLRYFAMTVGLSLLLLVAVGASTVLDLVSQLDLTRFGFDGTLFASLSGRVASLVSIFTTITLIYKLVPYERHAWRDILPGALAATLLFELGKALFVLYLGNVGNLEAVYGSLTSVIVLLLWLYFSARVLLFGAEICALRIDDRSASVQ